MSKTVWHKGPPPHVGWWNASRSRNKNNGRSWRWWNGERWSGVVMEEYSAESAGYYAESTKAYHSDEKPIEWSTYYPKNARVPRIDPNKISAPKEAKIRLVA